MALKVAIFYLGTGLGLFVNFVWSSAWVYWTPDTHRTSELDMLEKQDDGGGRLSKATTLTKLKRTTTDSDGTPEKKQ